MVGPRGAAIGRDERADRAGDCVRAQLGEHVAVAVSGGGGGAGLMATASVRLEMRRLSEAARVRLENTV